MTMLYGTPISYKPFRPFGYQPRILPSGVEMLVAVDHPQAPVPEDVEARIDAIWVKAWRAAYQRERAELAALAEVGLDGVYAPEIGGEG